MGESRRWPSSRRMRRESIANNTTAALVFPFAMNEMSELNTKKTAVPEWQEKWNKEKQKQNWCVIRSGSHESTAHQGMEEGWSEIGFGGGS